MRCRTAVGGRSAPLHFAARVLRRDERSSDGAPATLLPHRGASSRLVVGVCSCCSWSSALALVAGSPTPLAAGRRSPASRSAGSERDARPRSWQRRSDALQRAPVDVRRRAAGRSGSRVPARRSARTGTAPCAAAAAAGRRLRARARRPPGPTPLFGVDVEADASRLSVGPRVHGRADRGAVDRPAVDAALRRPGSRSGHARRAPACASTAPRQRPHRRGARRRSSAAGPVGCRSSRRSPSDAGELAKAAVACAIAALRARDPHASRADAASACPAGGSRSSCAFRAAARPRSRSPGRRPTAGSPPSPGPSAARPRDATFAVVPGGIEVVPARPGRALDVDGSRAAIERAVFSDDRQDGDARRRDAEPERSTAEAKAMGITGVVGSYTTTYGGTPGGVHNVQLVADLIDGALSRRAPGSRSTRRPASATRRRASRRRR